MKGLFLAGLGLASVVVVAAAPWVGEQAHAGDFPLVCDSRAAVIVFSTGDFKVVDIAAHDLAADVERVTGRKPVVRSAVAGLAAPAVLVGTLGHSPLIDGLVSAGRLNAAGLHGAWESFIITTVLNPWPGVPAALVIAGSDRRGTAFGIYELSQAIGVSPWYWWADVTPAKKSALFVAAGTRRFGPPSVQYRGIFLNDEDWGLQPWAAKTFEPEVGDIGPKTYAKICELLLRLKANTLWPAMHPCTKAFNLYPGNKLVADDYAIVMGSSHAEPMLRNNVTEWTAPHEAYNYVTNREGVRQYWAERVQENGRFENIYTLGMRGIHDSAMVGPKTDPERIRVLEQVFADQREMLARYASPRAEAPLAGARGRPQGTPLQNASVPQIFCAYKEVLALYRQGLKVPDDVTIMWPDDNFGYIRDFASAEELKRSGGFGVYYHISYLGAPLSYLWLDTTPPALIWEEMSKAYDHGAKKIWILNIGDLKPGEIGTEFFLQMAWDINRWRRDNVSDFLPEWAAREFGAKDAPEIGDLMAGYYRLNFVRRPEHLQWWLPKETPRPSPLSRTEIEERLAAWHRLAAQAGRLAADEPKDAFEELVGYPVQAAALANQRYFLGELGEADQARAADAGLKERTRHFNEEVAAGKWRGILNLEPADNQWKSFRIAPWVPPAFPPKPAAAADRTIRIDASQFTGRTDRGGVAWQVIPGLGVALFPTTAAPGVWTKPRETLPSLEYPVDLPEPGDYTLEVQLLPTHPLVAGHGLPFGLGLDRIEPVPLVYNGQDGSAEWAQGVLHNEFAPKLVTWHVTAGGKHTLTLYGMDAGVVVRKFVIRKL